MSGTRRIPANAVRCLAIRLTRVPPALIPIACTAASAAPAWAHTSERGIVLLLPTGYYIVGGTLAVAATFLLLLLVPNGWVRRLAAGRMDIAALPSVPRAATSAIAFALLVLLLLSGVLGARDPLANPLPLSIWTLWWVGLTIAQALFGNLWALLNPWIAPYRLLRALEASTARARTGPSALRYPEWLGYWPAIVAFLGFAWFELVYPAPDDPDRLAIAAAVYTAVTLAGMRLFGERDWLARAECFSVFFGLVGQLSPLRPAAAPPGERHRLRLAFPGAALASRGPLPISGVLFVLLTLASVSFDGLSRTFWWLDLGGINPLAYPGRTALVLQNSLGLVGLWGVLAAGYGLSIALGSRLAGGDFPVRPSLGMFVLSILPISIGYHFAHYLTTFLVNAQYAVLAIADPFNRGWDLLGLGHRHVVVSFLTDYDSVSLIWKLQAAGVVGGHVVAVLLAHMIAVRYFDGPRAVLAGLAPFTALMVGYTLFGLWLLAAPAAG